MSGFFLYFPILSSVYWLTALIDKSDRTKLSRLAITFFVTPFLAAAFGMGMPKIGLTGLGNSLALWTALLFSIPSWIVAGVLVIFDISKNAIGDRDK